MTRGRSSRGEGAFGTIVGLAILVVVAIALFKIVPLHIHGNEVYDAMNEAANFGGIKTTDKLAYDVFIRAQEAGVPLPITDIKITKQGSDIVIAAAYQQKVTVLGFKYTYKFDRSVSKPVF